jgi:hypothetical protein
MKIIVKTSKSAEMKVLLEKSSAEVKKQSHGMAEFNITQLDDNRFEIHIDYALQNRVFDWQYKKNLQNAIRNFDKDAKFEDVKK